MLNKSHEQCLNKSLESGLHVQSAVKPLHYHMIAFLGAVAEPPVSSDLIRKVHFLASSCMFVHHIIDKSYCNIMGLQFVATRIFLNVFITL